MLSSSFGLMSQSANETNSAPFERSLSKAWHADWFWLAFLFCVKLITDLVFWKHQASELSLDNIDYLDYAKQYFYTKDAVSFYQVFLTSFGKLRSPFQSWLIYMGKLALPHLSFGAVAYVIQSAASSRRLACHCQAHRAVAKCRLECFLHDCHFVRNSFRSAFHWINKRNTGGGFVDGLYISLYSYLLIHRPDSHGNRRLPPECRICCRHID